MQATKSAKTVKQVLIAIKYMYQNVLEHTKEAFYRDADGRAVTIPWIEREEGNFVPKGAASACFVGALYTINADAETKDATRVAVEHHLNTTSLPLHATIMAWNDVKGRTKAQVIDLLDQVILSLPNDK